MMYSSLATQCNLKLELVSDTSHSYLFLGFYKDVQIIIEELKIRRPIFIIEQGDHNLILGQLFLNSIKFSQEYKPDDILNIIIHLYTQ